MNLSRLLKYFTPKEKKFYGMFNFAAQNCVEAAAELNKLFDSTSEEEQKAIRLTIKSIEKKGDEVTNQIFDELNNTFIIPFDREDIHELTTTIDDVVDLIYRLAGKIEFYHFSTFSKHMHEMAALIQEGCLKIQVAVNGLENLKNTDKTLRACKDLHKLESRADEFYKLAISNLFENEKNAIELIKQKEVLQNLEKIANKIEDVSDVVKTILVKYA